jgi:hypothetical protein
MRLNDFLPFQNAPSKTSKKQASILPIDDQRGLSRAFRVAALALGFQNFSTRSYTGDTFELPPFDFDRIIQAVDTDSYARQAMGKYRELFWKEGWNIVSENSEARGYLLQRIDFMEAAMKKSFQDFLIDVGDQLVKFGNVFIVKSRGPLQDYYPGRLYPPEGRNPIIGYYIIPTERVEIMRNKNNKVLWYRQRTDMTGLGSTDMSPRWPADDVIHISTDKKPGRVFGTPFIVSAMDDIIALRQIEEDIQNLVHRELFPLYKFKVGTDDQPATDEELDKAANEIEGLRSEGALIMSNRHDVEVLGANGNALDASKYLEHFKERVAIGLGVYPHHLGMTSNASQAMTDRLDIALYDKIKEYQRKFEDAMRLFIFNELLLEGGFDPYTNPEMVNSSDRCFFKFNEIDSDTEVKKGAYIIQKVLAGIETVPEGRLELGMKPEMDSSEISPQANPGLSTGAQNTPEPKNNRKGSDNMIRPSNQYGTRTSPNIRRSDNFDLISEIVELVDDMIEE